VDGAAAAAAGGERRVRSAAFRYARPAGADEATALLAEAGGDGVVLAGGQSLVPLLAFRVARPELVVDVNRAEGLDGLRVDGVVALGALVRQQRALLSAELRAACPLLAAALPFVGVRETRLRGTVVGSMTHADPAAEVPTAAVALDAELELRSAGGSRVLRAGEFFLAPFLTARLPTELVTEIRFPLAPARSGWAFLEHAQGPLAVVAVAAGIVLDECGRVAEARLGLGGVGPVPLRAHGAEALLRGEEPAADAFAAAAEAAAAETDPPGDLLASAAYRRLAARRLVEDALARAAQGARAA
jgi:carbon-monoxide dehydrogenase medium subunit